MSVLHFQNYILYEFPLVKTHIIENGFKKKSLDKIDPQQIFKRCETTIYGTKKTSSYTSPH